MLSQDTAEKKEEGQAVDDAAGSDVPSRFTYKKGECTAARAIRRTSCFIFLTGFCYFGTMLRIFK